MSAKESGLRGLWEETVRYSWNTPKELALVTVGDLIQSIVPPSPGVSCRSSSLLSAMVRGIGGDDTGKESQKRAGSR